MNTNELFTKYVELLKENEEQAATFFDQHKANERFANLVQLRTQYLNELKNYLTKELKNLNETN